MIRLLQLILIFVVPLLFSCGQSERAGTDTGNPLLTGIVTDGQGMPLAAAQVILLDRDTSEQSLSAGFAGTSNVKILDTVLTDAQGRFHFSVLPKGSTVIQALWWDSLGVVYEEPNVQPGDQVFLQASPLVRINVGDWEFLEIGLAPTGSVIAGLRTDNYWLLPSGNQIVDAVHVREGVRGLLQRRVVQLEPGSEIELDTLFSSDSLRNRAQWLETVLGELRRLNIVPQEARRQLVLATEAYQIQALIEACELGGYSINQCLTQRCFYSEWRGEGAGLSTELNIASIWTGTASLCLLRSKDDLSAGSIGPVFLPLLTQ